MLKLRSMGLAVLQVALRGRRPFFEVSPFGRAWRSGAQIWASAATHAKRAAVHALGRTSADPGCYLCGGSAGTLHPQTYFRLGAAMMVWTELGQLSPRFPDLCLWLTNQLAVTLALERPHCF